MLNKITLIGRLSKDPKETKKGVYFMLLTNKSYKDKEGEWQEQTTAHNVMVYGKLADRILKGFKKGELVYVEGEQNNIYKEDDDGRYLDGSMVNAYVVKKLSKVEGGEDDEAPAQKKSSGSKSRGRRKSSNDDNGDDDLPF
jgi:single-strand DNA-binding protein